MVSSHSWSVIPYNIRVVEFIYMEVRFPYRGQIASSSKIAKEKQEDILELSLRSHSIITSAQIYHFFGLFLEHSWPFSDFTPTLFRDHSWRHLGNHVQCQGSTQRRLCTCYTISLAPKSVI